MNFFVSHSPSAYILSRVTPGVSSTIDILSPILCQIDAVRQCGSTVLVAIEGRCASGKSTLADQLSAHYACPVIHMDEFFLRPEQRTQERYATPGENIDHERFLEEVLLPIRRGQRVLYRPYSCQTQQLTDPILLPTSPIYIVEGSYSTHPELIEEYDLRIFLKTDPQTQIGRIRVRDGEEYAKVFEEKWIPLENRYF